MNKFEINSPIKFKGETTVLDTETGKTHKAEYSFTASNVVYEKPDVLNITLLKEDTVLWELNIKDQTESEVDKKESHPSNIEKLSFIMDNLIEKIDFDLGNASTYEHLVTLYDFFTGLNHYTWGISFANRDVYGAMCYEKRKELIKLNLSLPDLMHRALDTGNITKFKILNKVQQPLIEIIDALEKHEVVPIYSGGIVPNSKTKLKPLTENEIVINISNLNPTGELSKKELLDKITKQIADRIEKSGRSLI